MKSPVCYLVAIFFLLVFFFLPVNNWAVEVGDQAPDFRLPLINDLNQVDQKPALTKSPGLFEVMRLSDYRGTMVYVDFWASYCKPCRESFPMLSRLRDKFDREIFEILAISNDFNPKESLRFINEYETTFPVLSDPTSLIAKRYGVKTLPKGFLVDEKGTVLLVHEGFQRQYIHDILAPVLEFSSRRSE